MAMWFEPEPPSILELSLSSSSSKIMTGAFPFDLGLEERFAEGGLPVGMGSLTSVFGAVMEGSGSPEGDCLGVLPDLLSSTS